MMKSAFYTPTDAAAFAAQDATDYTLISDTLVDMDKVSSKVLRQVIEDIEAEISSRRPPVESDLFKPLDELWNDFEKIFSGDPSPF